MKLTTKQAVTVAVIARLYKRNPSIHLDDVRRMMQHKGIISKRCREMGWTYFEVNTTRRKAKYLSSIAYAIISAVEVLGLTNPDTPPCVLGCSWSARWRQTKRALRAEIAAKDFCEDCCAKLAAYLDDVDAGLPGRTN